MKIHDGRGLCDITYTIIGQNVWNFGYLPLRLTPVPMMRWQRSLATIVTTPQPI
jgi:hypothetical protein